MRITEENYVEEAERVIRKLKKEEDDRVKNGGLVTTSKIRNLLGMTADIYNDVLKNREEELPNEITGRIRYLKIRFVYEAGREPKVKRLIDEAELLAVLDWIEGKRSRYILFSQYMEALVAYRKFLGGKDE